MRQVTNATEWYNNTSLPDRMSGSPTLPIYTHMKIDTYMQLTPMLRMAVVQACGILTSFIFFVAQIHHYEIFKSGLVETI